MWIFTRQKNPIVMKTCFSDAKLMKQFGNPLFLREPPLPLSTNPPYFWAIFSWPHCLFKFQKHFGEETMFNYFFLCSLCSCSIKTHLSRTTTAKLHIPTNVSAIFHIANVANTTFWLNSTFSVICPSSYCNTFHKSFFGGVTYQIYC